MASPAGILRKLMIERGFEEVKAMLVVQITSLCEFFNFNRTMNASQVMETAEIIMEDYAIYTPEDFILCFRNIKALRYGKMMEGIDGAKILSMIREYDIEREEKWLEEKKKQSHQNKLDLKTMPDAIYQASKEMFKKSEEAKRKTPITISDDPIQNYLNDFDKLYNTQKPTGSGMRFVDYKGKMMDQQQYATVRYNEDH